MFRLFRFSFKTIVLMQLLALAFSAGMGAAYVVGLRRQYGSWGKTHGEDARAMAGDDLVAAPDLVETRSIDLDAAPGEVWPWLAQLGYGRGGWYSFPVLDRPWAPSGGPTRRSVDEILPEYGALAEGDIVPTQMGAGFIARVVQPGEALVLYLDDEITRAQLREVVEAAADADRDEAAEGTDADLELTDQVPPYQVTFAYELESLPGGRSRLTERLRVHFEASEQQWRLRPALVLALFAFMRCQLLGIKRRAEGFEED